jgi:hypothetical protein
MKLNYGTDYLIKVKLRSGSFTARPDIRWEANTALAQMRNNLGRNLTDFHSILRDRLTLQSK